MSGGDRGLVGWRGGLPDPTAAGRCWRPATRPPTTCPGRRSCPEPSERRAGSSFCEWKGAARYLDVVGGDQVAERVGLVLSGSRRSAFAELVDHVALYAGPMDRVLVDGEVVVPQPGGFYGGWITSAVTGPFKGVPGSQGW